METVPTATAATAEDFSSSSSSTSPTAAISRWKYNVSRRYQHLLDKSVPHVLHRWVVCLAVVSIYAIDPEYSDGPTLPTRGSDEFRPFVRRLPEFKFWYCVTRSFCIGFVLTFFSAFDVPVFWPILLFYWLMLFTLTMRRQIMHMIKYRYVPFSLGKQRYDGKRPSSSDATSSED
ncbi:protein RER1C [Citrus sinensis]|nr:protein RER1C [Citrus sinensis]